MIRRYLQTRTICSPQRVRLGNSGKPTNVFCLRMVLVRLAVRSRMNLVDMTDSTDEEAAGDALFLPSAQVSRAPLRRRPPFSDLALQEV